MVREYKKSELGAIPKEWDVLPFKEVFRILSNNTLARDQLNYDNGPAKDIHYGDVLILYPEVLNCAREDIPYINESALLSGQPLQDGDVVIADTAEDETVGKATEIVNKGNINVVAGLHTIPCRVKKGKFYPGWLGYYINSHFYHDQLIPYIHGTKVSSIDRESLNETYILVPPYDQQQRIVNALTDIEKLINVSKELTEKSNNLKKGCLQKMFPNKGQVEPDMRLPGFTGPWEQRKLGDIVDFLDTQRKPLTENVREKGPYPYYGASGIVDYVAGYIFDEELILLSEDGANITDRNYPVCFLASGKYWVNNHAHVLKAKAGMDNNFICNALERKNFSNYNTGMAMPKLNQDTCKQIPVDCPTYAEQKKIGDYFRNLDNLITLHQREYEKYQMIKQGMIEELISGQTEIR